MARHRFPRTFQAVLQYLLVQRRFRARHAEHDRASPGWEGGSTPAEGRADSVPEAGGTGAEAVATPTTPTAGHDADSPATSTASTGDDRSAAREHPATGRMDARPGGSGQTQRARCRSGDDLPGVRGGTAPRQPPPGTHEVWPHGVCCLRTLRPSASPCLLGQLTMAQASPADASETPLRTLPEPHQPAVELRSRRAQSKDHFPSSDLGRFLVLPMTFSKGTFVDGKSPPITDLACSDSVATFHAVICHPVLVRRATNVGKHLCIVLHSRSPTAESLRCRASHTPEDPSSTERLSPLAVRGQPR